MEYLIAISTISAIVWMLIPIFQRNNQYFYFFLVLALGGTYGFLAFIFSIGSPVHSILPIAILVFPGLYRRFFRKYYLLMILSAIALFFGSYLITMQQIQQFSLVSFIITLIVLGFKVFKEVLESQKIIINHILILVYQLSLVLKYLLIVKEQHAGMLLFFISATFEIIIGISLYFIKEDNPKFVYKIK